ncbi:MAG: hypothetical protein Kow00128_11850 [Deltaproteobacteria bacterium]
MNESTGNSKFRVLPESQENLSIIIRHDRNIGVKDTDESEILLCQSSTCLSKCKYFGDKPFLLQTLLASHEIYEPVLRCIVLNDPIRTVR